MPSSRRCDEKRSGNVSIFLTVRCMKAYQTLGVNFLPMSASSELEPGPSGLRPVVGLRVQPTLGVSRTSREMGLRAQADGRGGFTSG
jgi:hypothetical protein